MTGRILLAAALAALAAGCDGVSAVQPSSPSRSMSATNVNEYYNCDDWEKYGVATGMFDDYSIAGMHLPAIVDASSPGAQNVTIDFSAYTAVANGVEYTVQANLMYSLRGAMGYVGGGQFVSVGPNERRYRMGGVVPAGAIYAGIYFSATTVSGEKVPLLRVRNTRTRYTPKLEPYDHFSPMNVVIVEPQPGDTLTEWPGIGNSEITGAGGVGIWGHVTYNDARANSTDHVWVSILRHSDDRWWDGDEWVAGYHKLAAAVNGDEWSMNQPPMGEHLTSGFYQLYVSAHSGAHAPNNPHFCTEDNIEVFFDRDHTHDQGSGS